MRFNYYSDLEEWASKAGYDADNFLDEEVVLQKSYSRIIRFYLLNEDGTYAQLTGYQSDVEGLYDLNLIQEGLTRHEEIVEVKKYSYV